MTGNRHGAEGPARARTRSAWGWRPRISPSAASLAAISLAFLVARWAALATGMSFAVAGAAAAVVGGVLAKRNRFHTPRAIALGATILALILAAAEFHGWWLFRAKVLAAKRAAAAIMQDDRADWELYCVTGYGLRVYCRDGIFPEDTTARAYGIIAPRDARWRARSEFGGVVIDERDYRTGRYRERIDPHAGAAPSYDGPVAFFLGCSFTFGWQLAFDETFPEQTARKLDGEVTAINLGQSGSSVGYVAKLLSPESRELPEFPRGRVRFGVLTTIADHLPRIMGHGAWQHTALYDVAAGELVPVPSPTKSAAAAVEQSLGGFLLPSYTFRPLAYRLLNYAPTREAIDRYVRLVCYSARRFRERYDAPLLVLQANTFGAVDESVATRLRTAGIEVLLERDIFPGGYVRFAQALDPHPSAEGAGQLAAAVAGWWRARPF